MDLLNPHWPVSEKLSLSPLRATESIKEATKNKYLVEIHQLLLGLLFLSQIGFPKRLLDLLMLAQSHCWQAKTAKYPALRRQKLIDEKLHIFYC